MRAMRQVMRRIRQVLLQVAGGGGVGALVDGQPVSIILQVVLPLHVRVHEDVWW